MSTMRGGRHAAGDGSFGRSAGTSTLRGAFLLVFAVVLGIVLLRTAPNDTVRAVSARPAPATTRPTTKPAAASSAPSTSVPPTTVPARPPGQVKVLVANGTTTPLGATRYATRLRLAGYDTLSPADALDTTQQTSHVYYTPGFQVEGVVLASSLALPASVVVPVPAPSPVSDATPKNYNVVLVLGVDLTSKLDNTPVAPPAGATTPTTRGAPVVTSPTSTPRATTTVKSPTTTAH